LTKEGVSLCISKLLFDELRFDIWSNIIERLTGIPDANHRNHNRRHRNALSDLIVLHPHPHPFQSVILNEITSILNEFEGKQWRLLYRGTIDGFSSSTFHNKCDGQSNTMTIITTMKGFIFGGFTPITWDSSNSFKADNTQRSFLFTSKNPRNIPARKFALSNSSAAIYCNGSYRSIFKGRHDISVANDCNANNNSHTCIGYGHANETGIDRAQVLTGE
jgi:hypothetical protein